MRLKISGVLGQVRFSHKNLSGNLFPVNCDIKFGFLGYQSSQPGIASCYSTNADINWILDDCKLLDRHMLNTQQLWANSFVTYTRIYLIFQTHFYRLVYSSCPAVLFLCFQVVLLIRDILIRIRIRGSVMHTNGSCYFSHWPSRRQFFLPFTFWRYTFTLFFRDKKS